MCDVTSALQTKGARWSWGYFPGREYEFTSICWIVFYQETEVVKLQPQHATLALVSPAGIVECADDAKT